MTESENPPELPEVKPEPDGIRLSIPMLILLVILVLLALYVGTQVISVLYNIAVPPMPPLPAALTQQSNSNLAYGVDEWLYTVDDDPCQVVALYTAEGAACRISPGVCAGGSTTAIAGDAALVARCYGQVDFSLFTMQYEAVVNSDEADHNAAHLHLIREIFWIGEGRQVEVRSTENPTLTP
jgi:hypothetical protein